MRSKSIARELSLLILGQMSDKDKFSIDDTTLEALLSKALDSLTQHWQDSLDECSKKIESAQQELLDIELKDSDQNSTEQVRDYLKDSLVDFELILNGISNSLELPKLLALSDQEEVRLNAIKRVNLVVNNMIDIDKRLDSVMEGWKLHRLPRIDRDILRLAIVDLVNLKIPKAVACNEAVELANRYSDEQGRKMINGILRRFQNHYLID